MWHNMPPSTSLFLAFLLGNFQGNRYQLDAVHCSTISFILFLFHHFYSFVILMLPISWIIIGADLCIDDPNIFNSFLYPAIHFCLSATSESVSKATNHFSLMIFFHSVSSSCFICHWTDIYQFLRFWLLLTNEAWWNDSLWEISL